MGLAGLFMFSVKCFEILAWPLLAFGYPLFASIKAIETNSNSDTHKLITYWISFSLILLFENAFEKPLEWLFFWPYIKLIVVFCLIAPRFDGSLYVYKNLVYPCLSMHPKFNKLKEFFFEKDKLLVEVERYVKENGPEALENLIASKSKVAKPCLLKDRNLDSKEKVINADSKLEMPKEKAKFSYKDVNPAEITEEKEMASTSQVRPTKATISLPENQTFAPLDIKEVATSGTAGKDCSDTQAMTSKLQNDWIDWVDSTNPVPSQGQSVTDHSYFEAMGEDASFELLRNPASSAKVAYPSNIKKSNEHMVTPSVASQDLLNNPVQPSVILQQDWSCAICQVRPPNETALNLHFQGKRHKKAVEQLKSKDQTRKTKEPSVPKVETQKHISSNDIQSNSGKRKAKDQGKQDNLTSKGVEMRGSLLWCTICNISCSCQKNMNSHLAGSKHLAKIRQLNSLLGSG